MPPVNWPEISKHESQLWPFAYRYNVVNFTTTDTANDRVITG